MDISWSVAEDLTGDWQMTYTSETPDGTDTSTDNYAADLTKVSKATYDIEVADLNFTGQCVVTDNEVVCDGDIANDDGSTSTFEGKAELAAE